MKTLPPTMERLDTRRIDSVKPRRRGRAGFEMSITSRPLYPAATYAYGDDTVIPDGVPQRASHPLSRRGPVGSLTSRSKSPYQSHNGTFSPARE
jgi:hypothetical protein